MQIEYQLTIQKDRLQVRALRRVPKCKKTYNDSANFLISRLQDINDKTTLIRLNRELRDFKEQAEVLRFESEQRKMVCFQVIIMIVNVF